MAPPTPDSRSRSRSGVGTSPLFFFPFFPFLSFSYFLGQRPTKTSFPLFFFWAVSSCRACLGTRPGFSKKGLGPRGPVVACPSRRNAAALNVPPRRTHHHHQHPTRYRTRTRTSHSVLQISVAKSREARSGRGKGAGEGAPTVAQTILIFFFFILFLLLSFLFFSFLFFSLAVLDAVRVRALLPISTSSSHRHVVAWPAPM